MWNMVTSSAADSSAGSAKKLRENTSNARCRAAGGKLMSRKKLSASTESRSVYVLGTETSKSDPAMARFIFRRSVSAKVLLRRRNPATFHGGVRGSPAKLSDVPLLCSNG
jgi:hypothetical protein